MIRYVCENGHLFERYRVMDVDRETGFEDQVCPVCGTHYFDEAFHCIKCGGYFTDEDMIGSICRDCVEQRATKANAYAYAMSIDHDPAEVDGLNELQAKAYCLEDRYDFSEFLEGRDD